VRENEGEGEASHDGNGCDKAPKVDRCGWLEGIIGKIVRTAMSEQRVWKWCKDEYEGDEEW